MSVKNCGHGLDHVSGCQECEMYSEMYRLDHDHDTSPGTGKKLEKLEKYFFGKDKR